MPTQSWSSACAPAILRTCVVNRVYTVEVVELIESFVVIKFIEVIDLFGLLLTQVISIILAGTESSY
jgi:hypothetical protein